MGGLDDVRQSIAETQQTYESIAPEYARRTATIFPELLDQVAELTAELPPGGLVADVGCGPGRDLAVLRGHGLRAIGLDLSAAQLRAGGLAGVVQADMCSLPL